MHVSQITQALLFSFCCLFTACVHADCPTAILDNIDTRIDLSSYLETIEDSNHAYTLEDIQAGKYDHLWQRNTQQYFIGKNADSKYWFRICLHWRGLQGIAGVVYVDSQPNLIFRLGAALPTTEKSYRVVNTGGLEPDSSRDIHGQRWGFKLPLLPNEAQNIIGWVDNREYAVPALLPLYLISEAGYDQIEHKFSLVLAAFYAGLFSLWIYNICLFLTLREAVYGLYILFLSGVFLLCAIVDGSSMRWLWSESPYFNQFMACITGIVMIMVYLEFVMRALNRAAYWPWFKKAYRLSMAVGFVTLVHHLFSPDFGFSAAINQVYSGLVMPVTMILIVLGIRHKQPTAGYFLVAEIMTVAGGASFMLMLQGILPINFITFWGLHWGFGGEALLLSLALAARTRIAQQDSIKHLENYEAIYQNSIEGMFQFDFKSRSLKCNNALAHLFGRESADELSGDSDVMSYFSKQTQENIVVDLQEKGYLRDYEVAIDNPHTDIKTWASMTTRMVRDKEGKPCGIEGSMVDITERKLKEQAEKAKQLAETERANAEKNQEISEAKNKAKTQFFASMSHEFRTPLTAILGYIDIAKRSEISEQERKDHIQTIAHSAQHMLQLINDILDLSKIEAQQMDVEHIPVDVFQLTQEVYDFVWILAEQKGIYFVIDYQLPLPNMFISDPMRLTQALVNLCSNSVKFTRSGGVTLHIACDADKNQMIFRVEDSGIGMKPDHLDKLFGAFVQADNSTSRNFGGTGLGLYLSKLIANKLGGNITVTSEYGKGSIFTLSVDLGIDENRIWLDVAPRKMAVSNPVNQRSNTNLSQIGENKPIKILLAEDNPVNQKLIGFYVKQAGVELVIANDGVEVLGECHRNTFDLILMDMEMPTMDGMTAVKYLRAKGFDKPIYALTANETSVAIQECIDAGCNGHLFKPLDTEKLREVIQSVSH